MKNLSTWGSGKLQFVRGNGGRIWNSLIDRKLYDYRGDTMSLQICPKCKRYSFTWFIDEEETPLTQWLCNACGYIAFEDETMESACPHCGKKTQSRLLDASGQYSWCSTTQEFNKDEKVNNLYYGKN
ncbi:hypothetical protein ACYULU_04635 [Breznakiellaceae bacterium SP9]